MSTTSRSLSRSSGVGAMTSASRSTRRRQRTCREQKGRRAAEPVHQQGHRLHAAERDELDLGGWSAGVCTFASR